MKIKKLISLILCAVLVAAVIPMQAFAENERKAIDSGFCGAQGENLSWILYDDGELVISGEGPMASYSIGSSTNQPGWYEYYDMIDVITLEEGVTIIGSNAFFSGSKDMGYKPVSYYRINLPKSLKSIYGSDTFDDNRIAGRHLAFCYAGTEEEWKAIFGEPSPDRYSAIYYNGEEPETFCELVETYGEIDIVTHYYAENPEAEKIEWYTINRGESTKVGETPARHYEIVELEIPDYRRGEVYLQAKIVDAQGEVIVSSQELYIGKNPTVFDRIKAYFQQVGAYFQIIGFYAYVILHMIPHLWIIIPELIKMRLGR